VRTTTQTSSSTTLEQQLLITSLLWKVLCLQFFQFELIFGTQWFGRPRGSIQKFDFKLIFFHQDREDAAAADELPPPSPPPQQQQQQPSNGDAGSFCK
jgi:hypothetical protein